MKAYPINGSGLQRSRQHGSAARRKSIDRLQDEIEEFGLGDEISVAQWWAILAAMMPCPMVIVYPEAVIYGPVKARRCALPGGRASL